MGFKDILLEDEINEMGIKFHTLLMLSEQVDTLNESFNVKDFLNEESKLNTKLNKFGLKIHKAKGIIDYVKSFSTGVGKVFLYMIKGDTEKAKELVKSMKKEDVLDFLYKLDLGTLHLVTGPLHAIDAWTGWDLSVNLKQHISKSDGFSDIFKAAISKVKDSIVKLFEPEKQKILLNHVMNLEIGAGIAEVSK